MADLYKGIAGSPITYLTSDISANQTTISIADDSALPDAPNICTIGYGEHLETIKYETKSNGVLQNVTRGIEGTPRAWQAGTEVARFFTAYDHNEIIDGIVGVDSDLETHMAEKATQDELGHVKMPNNWLGFSDTLVNGWSYLDALYVQKDDFGILRVRGTVQDGVKTPGTIICTLPDGYRPSTRQIIITQTNDGTSGSSELLILDCRTDGTIRIHASSVSAKKYISFYNIFLY